nr:TPA_inf: spike protein [Trout perch letovirus]
MYCMLLLLSLLPLGALQLALNTTIVSNGRVSHVDAKGLVVFNVSCSTSISTVKYCESQETDFDGTITVPEGYFCPVASSSQFCIDYTRTVSIMGNNQLARCGGTNFNNPTTAPPFGSWLSTAPNLGINEPLNSTARVLVPNPIKNAHNAFPTDYCQHNQRGFSASPLMLSLGFRPGESSGNAHLQRTQGLGWGNFPGYSKNTPVTVYFSGYGSPEQEAQYVPSLFQDNYIAYDQYYRQLWKFLSSYNTASQLFVQSFTSSTVRCGTFNSGTFDYVNSVCINQLGNDRISPVCINQPTASHVPGCSQLWVNQLDSTSFTSPTGSPASAIYAVVPELPRAVMVANGFVDFYVFRPVDQLTYQCPAYLSPALLTICQAYLAGTAVTDTMITTAANNHHCHSNGDYNYCVQTVQGNSIRQVRYQVTTATATQANYPFVFPATWWAGFDPCYNCYVKLLPLAYFSTPDFNAYSYLGMYNIEYTCSAAQGCIPPPYIPYDLTAEIKGLTYWHKIADSVLNAELPCTNYMANPLVAMQEKRHLAVPWSMDARTPTGFYKFVLTHNNGTFASNPTSVGHFLNGTQIIYTTPDYVLTKTPLPPNSQLGPIRAGLYASLKNEEIHYYVYDKPYTGTYFAKGYYLSYSPLCVTTTTTTPPAALYDNNCDCSHRDLSADFCVCYQKPGVATVYVKNTTTIVQNLFNSPLGFSQTLIPTQYDVEVVVKQLVVALPPINIPDCALFLCGTDPNCHNFVSNSEYAKSCQFATNTVRGVQQQLTSINQEAAAVIRTFQEQIRMSTVPEALDPTVLSANLGNLSTMQTLVAATRSTATTIASTLAPSLVPTSIWGMWASNSASWYGNTYNLEWPFTTPGEAVGLSAWAPTGIGFLTEKVNSIAFAAMAFSANIDTLMQNDNTLIENDHALANGINLLQAKLTILSTTMYDTIASINALDQAQTVAIAVLSQQLQQLAKDTNAAFANLQGQINILTSRVINLEGKVSMANYVAARSFAFQSLMQSMLTRYQAQLDKATQFMDLVKKCSNSYQPDAFECTSKQGYLLQSSVFSNGGLLRYTALVNTPTEKESFYTSAMFCHDAKQYIAKPGYTYVMLRDTIYVTSVKYYFPTNISSENSEILPGCKKGVYVTTFDLTNIAFPVVDLNGGTPPALLQVNATLVNALNSVNASLLSLVTQFGTNFLSQLSNTNYTLASLSNLFTSLNHTVNNFIKPITPVNTTLLYLLQDQVAYNLKLLYNATLDIAALKNVTIKPVQQLNYYNFTGGSTFLPGQNSGDIAFIFCVVLAVVLVAVLIALIIAISIKKYNGRLHQQ